MFEKIATLGYGGKDLNTVLARALIELQSKQTEVLAGSAGAATLLPSTKGLDQRDTLYSAIMYAAGVPSDITAACSIVDLRATGTLTLAGVVAGDVVSVNGKAYTAKTFAMSPSNGAIGPYNFAVGATDTLTAADLARSINAADPAVIASSAVGVVTVVAAASGVAGNAIALAIAASNGHATRSAATLAGGAATGGILSSTVTTGNMVVLTWYKKSRTVGQL